MYNIIVVALACWEAIEIWRHSSLMAPCRAEVETWEGPVLGRLRSLLECPFCLAPWTALVLLVCGTTPLLSWIVPVLAIARLANLGNDVFHAWCRTPRENRL